MHRYWDLSGRRIRLDASGSMVSMFGGYEGFPRLSLQLMDTAIVSALSLSGVPRSSSSSIIPWFGHPWVVEGYLDGATASPGRILRHSRGFIRVLEIWWDHLWRSATPLTRQLASHRGGSPSTNQMGEPLLYVSDSIRVSHIEGNTSWIFIEDAVSSTESMVVGSSRFCIPTLQNVNGFANYRFRK
ncbi:hypothetical protein FNV43_RR01541 [Rhamnella rubrinervis]|uniref:Uncharacterized protein n=1 Tax=Rhamnella rubrinervis TaxID=2594499 RepID=A0A8K0HPU3_9ROSA|nr:hypothetical protein FNV43_RR01541 [Rhamnella rubrinervis]